MMDRIPGRHAPALEARRQREHVLAKRRLEFGQRAEREAQLEGAAVEPRLDLAAVLVRHGPPQIAEDELARRLERDLEPNLAVMPARQLERADLETVPPPCRSPMTICHSRIVPLNT